MATRAYNGQEAEVIVSFHDGYSYSKARLEASLRELVYDRKPVKPAKEPINAKREDVDIIVSVPGTSLRDMPESDELCQVNEFEIPRQQAEKLLTEHGGDLDKALRALVNS
ncbi:hypothetical protein EDD16DRAFT_1699893 [Pisolithus croceorrhizus]|nr:hypothetical protein EDD16DRAFT_1699893 [Pisolithus croceorrhizus]